MCMVRAMCAPAADMRVEDDEVNDNGTATADDRGDPDVVVVAARGREATVSVGIGIARTWLR